MAQPMEPVRERHSLNLAEALTAHRTLPARERLVELDRELRAELAHFMPLVQRQADDLNRGTIAWNMRVHALNASRNALACELSMSSLHAAMDVAELGRRLRELVGYAREDDPA
ncbi:MULTISPECIES: DUF6415 family natural product biosynthesis protein [unclassified Streptomyces]|uniref:DUF6415 family natural product biosynthesis protein n=1 Tax=Streptomyces sp. SYP-A7185 TaxID=3040076 RepID=UPI0038F5EE2F